MARRALFPVILLTAVLLLAGAGTALSGPWEDALQGAKKEGTVSVIASVGSDFRQVLTTPFEKKFGIRVEYISMQGSAQSARVSRERRAGLSGRLHDGSRDRGHCSGPCPKTAGSRPVTS